MAPLRVGVLGPVTVWREGHELGAGQPRQLAVLGVLASRANRVVSRGELVDAVWGEEPPASAENGIYTYVAGLRRVLEPDGPDRGPGRPRRGPGTGACLLGRRLPAAPRPRWPRRRALRGVPRPGARAARGGRHGRRGVRGERGARPVARPAVRRGARAVRRGGAAAARRAAHHRGRGAGGPDARPGAARGGGARADRADGRAPAARAGARAADDRPVPVRAPGGGAAGLPRRQEAARR